MSTTVTLIKKKLILCNIRQHPDFSKQTAAAPGTIQIG